MYLNRRQWEREFDPTQSAPREIEIEQQRGLHIREVFDKRKHECSIACIRS